VPELFRNAIPVSDLDPFSAESIVDAHRVDGELRELGPVVHLSRYDILAVARHESVKAVLGDWATYSSKNRPFNDDATLVPQVLVTDDPPEHGVIRAHLMQFFTPVRMKDIRGAFEAQADAIVDAALSRDGIIDGARDIAQPFILSAFPDLLGLPTERREDLLLFGEAIFNGAGPRNAIFFEALERCAPGFTWVAEQTTRDRVTPGGLAAQTYALADAGEITEQEADLLVKTMLGAGFDTTIAAIANALKAFGDFPKEWEKVHAAPALAKNAVEEILRFDPPARMMGRIVTKDTELDGAPLKAGDRIGAFLDAAGRDGRRWAEPDRFDVTRKGPHLGFGHGVHQCLGQALARLEAETMLTALARRVKRIEAAGQPARLINNNVLAWTSVPMRLHAA
jgi:cytochrome P450